MKKTKLKKRVEMLVAANNDDRKDFAEKVKKLQAVIESKNNTIEADKQWLESAESALNYKEIRENDIAEFTAKMMAYQVRNG